MTQESVVEPGDAEVDQVQSTEGDTESQVGDQPEVASEETTETFASSFDPNELPVEVQPAYKNMLADYTRKTQELAGQRKSAEPAIQMWQALQDEQTREQAFRQLAGSLGYEIDGDDADDLFDDDDEPAVDPRLDEILAWKQQQEQSQQFEQVADWAAGEVEAIEAEAGREFTSDELGLIRQISFANPAEDGLPDVRGAYAALLKFESEAQQRWLNSKQGVSRAPGRGAVADRRVDRNNRDERRAAMAEAIEAAGFSPE